MDTTSFPLGRTDPSDQVSTAPGEFQSRQSHADAVERRARDRGPAEPLAAFEDEHGSAGAAEERRGDEAVVAAADDDGVVAAARRHREHSDE
jgi:hypothetical protein